MPYKYNGRVIKEGRSFKLSDGTTLPSSWSRLSDAEKADLGIVWEADPLPHDNRFYWGRDAEGNLIERLLKDRPEFEEDGVTPLLDEKGNQVITLGLKSNAIAKVKQQAKGLIDATEWYITRESETGVLAPTQIKAYRQAVRVASNTIESTITATTTLAEFMALHDTPVDAEGNPTGNAPINDWPAEDDTFDFVPDQVSMRQARLALLASGLLDSVDTAIADPAAKVEWEYAQAIKRTSPLITALAGGLGLTEAQIDDLFKAASVL